jgi:hypothetical protein
MNRQKLKKSNQHWDQNVGMACIVDFFLVFLYLVCGLSLAFVIEYWTGKVHIQWITGSREGQ